jgi:hypothetical protein
MLAVAVGSLSGAQGKLRKVQNCGSLCSSPHASGPRGVCAVEGTAPNGSFDFSLSWMDCFHFKNFN